MFCFVVTRYIVSLIQLAYSNLNILFYFIAAKCIAKYIVQLLDFFIVLFGYSCRIPLVKPLLNHRQTSEEKNWTVAQWSKVLFSDESKFCISFGNQGPKVWRKGGEAHNPSCLKSGVKFPQSVMIWAAMSSAGVGPLGQSFLRDSIKQYEQYKNITPNKTFDCTIYLS